LTFNTITFVFIIIRRRVYSCSANQTLKIDWSTIVKKWNSSRGNLNPIVRSDTWKRRLHYYIWRHFWDTPSERYTTYMYIYIYTRIYICPTIIIVKVNRLNKIVWFFKARVRTAPMEIGKCVAVPGDRSQRFQTGPRRIYAIGKTPTATIISLCLTTVDTAIKIRFSQMWACKKGHKDTAILLCQWYQTVQNSNNDFNQQYCQPDILESVHQCT